MSADPLVNSEPVCFVAHGDAQVQADVASGAAVACQRQFVLSVAKAPLDMGANARFVVTDNAVAPARGIVDLGLVLFAKTHVRQYNVEFCGIGQRVHAAGSVTSFGNAADPLDNLRCTT